MAFLNDDDFENIPDDDAEAFAFLEGKSRSRLFEQERFDNNNLSYEDVVGYMNEISALAEHFNIPGINFDIENSNFNYEFGNFTRKVEFRTVQIKAQKARRQKKESVAISGAGRERIQHYLEKLKKEIEEADIPEKRKKSLFDKIAEFESELAKKRFNLALAMGVVALVATTASGFTGAANNILKIVESISAIIGDEKQKEEDNLILIPAREPFKAIPDMRRKDVSESNDLDDDIPF